MDTRPPEHQRYARPPVDFPAAQRTIAQLNLRAADAALAQRCIEAGIQAQAQKITRLESQIRALNNRLAKLEHKKDTNT